MSDMREFIAHKNITHYQDRLKVGTEPGIRATLLGLLGDEEAKLAAYARENKMPPGTH